MTAQKNTYFFEETTPEEGMPMYFLDVNRDSLGNVRAVVYFWAVLGVPVVNSLSDYMPFGSQIQSRTFNPDLMKRGFNGKENDIEIKGQGNSQDFGARLYDNRLGRWFKPDRYEALYESLSPYNFVANTPIQATDADGNLIVFVNGYHSFPASGPGGAGYWSKEVKTRAKNALHDQDAYFVDGEGYGLGSGSGRRLSGELDDKNVNEIIRLYQEELKKDPNATIKFVTHSQGAQYAEGLAKALKKRGFKIEIAIHLQPSNSGDCAYDETAIEQRIGVYTEGDWVANKTGQRFRYGENVEITEDKTRYKGLLSYKLNYWKGNKLGGNKPYRAETIYGKGDYGTFNRERDVAHGLNWEKRGVWDAVQRSINNANLHINNNPGDPNWGKSQHDIKTVKH